MGTKEEKAALSKSSEDAYLQYLQATQRVGRLVGEITKLREENEALVREIEAWKAASMLVDGSGDPDGVTPAVLERFRTRNDRIVDELPKTVDGVPMVPKGAYWCWCSDEWNSTDIKLLECFWWQGDGPDCYNPEFTFASDRYPEWEFFVVHKTYSTHGAALEGGA